MFTAIYCIINIKGNIYTDTLKCWRRASSSITTGNNIDHIGNFIETSNIQNKFNIFGTTIDKLISDKIIEIPNYIKIDVDGIEHLIVRGAQNLLKNDELQGLLIEMNPDYQEQYEFINKIMEDNNFKKTTSTNARLTKEKWSKRFTNENINVIFKKNI